MSIENISEGVIEHLALPHRTHGLSVDALTAGYHGLPAVRNVSLQCPAGQILAMIGPNGAGKSTTLSAIVGLIKPMAGDVRIGDVQLRGLSPHQVSRQGVAMIASDRGVFGSLTVAEHLRLAARSPSRRGRGVLGGAPKMRSRSSRHLSAGGRTARLSCLAESSRCWQSPKPSCWGPAFCW